MLAAVTPFENVQQERLSGSYLQYDPLMVVVVLGLGTLSLGLVGMVNVEAKG